jgi:hypothetical protein
MHPGGPGRYLFLSIKKRSKLRFSSVCTNYFRIVNITSSSAPYSITLGRTSQANSSKRLYDRGRLDALPDPACGPNDNLFPFPSAPEISASVGTVLFRKEVIQPQVLLQLPCYDFTPITNHTLGACLLAVSEATSSAACFRDVTGGVYKARERIHRSVLIRDY